MKALKILDRAFIDYIYDEVIIRGSSLDNTMDSIDEARDEIEELNQILIDLFAAIELSENEPDEKRFSSIEIYLQRLGKFKKMVFGTSKTTDATETNKMEDN